MACPICDQKPANCDCTAEERRQYGEIEDLECEVSALKERLKSENAIAVSRQAIIDRLRAERRWIPVDERLPEDGNDVLVRYRYGHKTVCVVAYRVSGNDCWTMSVGDCFDFADEQATHWMPLPAPPTDAK